MKKEFSRKDFLVSAGKAGCAMLIAGAASSLLQACGSAAVLVANANEKGQVSIPLSAFATGSTRIVRVEKLPYDILVVKKSEEEYQALLMRCTHQDWALTPNPKGLSCSLHGSTFDLNGNVTSGPAPESLKKLKVNKQNDQLIIS
jgi:Rieske Fe-S protein